MGGLKNCKRILLSCLDVMIMIGLTMRRFLGLHIASMSFLDRTYTACFGARSPESASSWAKECCRSRTPTTASQSDALTTVHMRLIFSWVLMEHTLPSANTCSKLSRQLATCPRWTMLRYRSVVSVSLARPLSLTPRTFPT